MRKLLYLLASAAVMAGGCSEKKETPAGEGCGTIRIACEADATIDAAAAMAAVQGATRAAAKPDGKDFTLRIRGENFDKSSISLYHTDPDSNRSDREVSPITHRIIHNDSYLEITM